MTASQLIVTIDGLVLIWLIYWFFFGKKQEPTVLKAGVINILVDGGYKPGVIKIKATKTTLVLTRTDANSCLEEVVIPDFKIKEYLPLNKPVSIEIEPKHKGEYDIHCGMNMFHGKIIVE